MSNLTWRPGASFDNLRARAQFLQQIRDFFAKREVIEVDTPILMKGVATDLGLEAFAVPCSDEGSFRYLQTSPEFAMKRLVAAGSGPIYYLGKAFRKGEVGKRHNPEFTMLEWYRPEWNHLQLIEEVQALMQALLDCQSAKIYTYQQLFEKYFDLNPHLATPVQLQDIALEQGWISETSLQSLVLDRDGWLDLLLSHGIEPHLGQTRPVVIIDYPASQASLAKTRTINAVVPYEVAERFEFYFKGMELTNGYHELTCPKEQRRRYELDIQNRKNQGHFSQLPLDNALLQALRSFPVCAGVAVGIDRLLMIKLNEMNIEKVIPFAWERA